jgi:AcrR family transcriptional regulator
MGNPLGTQDSTDIAVFECIVAHGIEAVTMEMIAGRAGQSRTSFYRQFPSLRHVVRNTHHRAVKLIGRWAPDRSRDLRFELEWWWATLQEFFTTEWGRAFLAMRPFAASGLPMHELERVEVALMPDLARWTGAPALSLRVVWSLALTAACPTFDEASRATLRELAYAVLSRHGAPNNDADDQLAELVALGSPL